ncbi:NAD(P)-binding domain-containing protein [Chitinophaga sp. MM2321]|uniref:NAD(P)-binding domain-containing protein n=1 Tax=Chitinophaga sp. MM2321 TaxID=3137178 RepID=UPI0032D5ADA9
MDQQLKKISILGCGWLGKPLALHFLQEGYPVKGARTSVEGVRELEAAGIDGYVVSLSETQLDAPEAFWDADILIVNIPPRIHRGVEAHVAEITLLRDKLQTTRIRRVLFVSSTSVYADINDLVTETNDVVPDTPNGQALRLAEQVLLRATGFRTTVLRFGGLIGYDRIPNSLSRISRRQLNDVPMNVIHRDDCIGVISRVIEKDVWGEIFNACAGGHPLRMNYYKAAAAAFNLEIPRKIQPWDLPYKIVTSSKLKKMLEYNFVLDDPLAVFNTVEK